jgi:ketosteroid isomerase-like protein
MVPRVAAWRHVRAGYAWITRGLGTRTGLVPNESAARSAGGQRGYWHVMPNEGAIAQPGAPERDLLDRLVLRVPAVADFLAGGIRRAPRGSALRRRLVNLQVKRVFGAMARSDVEVVLLSYEADVEVWMRSMAGVGVSDCYRGHQGVRDVYAEIDDVFDYWGWTLRTVADGGDRFAVGGDFVGHGRRSGVEVAVSNGGTAVTLSPRGRVVWQEWFVEPNGFLKALEAVGLRE